jgi:trigger factor
MVDKLTTIAKFEAKVNNTGTLTFEVSKEQFIQRFGEESLYEDTLNYVLPSHFDAAVEETGISTSGQPEILPESLAKGENWVIKANVILTPKVNLGEYKGIEVPAADTAVTDAEIDSEIEHLRQTEAELVPAKEDEAAALGDTVVIDFDGSVDGEHFEGGKAEDFSLSLGSGQFIPGFEDQLVGHKAGEDVNVNVTFPEEYQAEDLAGKPALFETKIHEIKKLVLPELDDEFAKDVDSEVSSLSELKAKISERLTAAKAETAKNDFEAAAIQKVVDNAKLEVEEIPHDMIEEDVHRQLHGFFNNLQQQGINPEMYFQLTGSSEDALHKQFEADSPNRIKTNLVLEEVAATENIKPTDAEIDAEYARLADEYQMEVSKLQDLIAPSLVAHDLKLQQAVDLITSNAKTK